MTASLKQIQSFVDHLREAGAAEVEITKGPLTLKVKFSERLSPTQWVDLMEQAKAREIIETGTDPSRSDEERRAAERLLFASSS